MNKPILDKDDIVTREFRLQRSETFTQYYQFSLRAEIGCSIGGFCDSLESYVQCCFLFGIAGAETRPKSASDAPPNPANWDIPGGKEYLCGLARASGYAGKSYNQHRIWQLHMLRNDPFTYATEVPVWSDRPDGYRGFIDLIRAKKTDSGRLAIQIIDLKPNAAAENKQKVFGQLAQYREMLIERLAKNNGQKPRNDIERIDCIFLDEYDAFRMVFPPILSPI